MASKKKTKKKTTKTKAAPKKAKPKAKPKAAPKKKKTVVVKKKVAAKKVAAKKQTKAAAKPKPKPKKKADVLPTAEEEARFWSLLEDAWATQGEEVNAARHALATRKPGSEPDDDAELVDDALEEVMENLKAAFAFEDFPKEELVAMDRVVERKLYDVDRKDVHDVTDGSDDGFLYCRGHIVALGKEFYDAVNANAKMALGDAECEEMCYLTAHVYSERFGNGTEFPETGADISRESFNNADAWPEFN